MANVGYGMAGFLGVAEESSWGTGVAAADYLELLSESVSSEIDRFDVTNIIGRLQEPDDAAGVHRIAGDISFAVHPENATYFIKGVLGVQSSTVVLSGTFHKHDFTFRDSDVSTAAPEQPLTLEINRDTGASKRYTGINVSQLEFNMAPNQALQATASVVGKDVSSLTATSPTYPSSPTGFFTFDTASVQIGGSANIRVEGLTITLQTQLEGVPTLNNTSRVAKLRRTGPQMVRISGNMAFEDYTEHDDFRNQTENQIIVSMTKATSHEIIFDMPRVVYSSFPLGMDGRGRQVVSFEGIARYDTGSNQNIKISVSNTSSSGL